MTTGSRLAFSSIAWEPADDAFVRELLVEHGVGAVELTPRKYWSSAPDVPKADLAAYRAFWAEAGITIVALQGILFGSPDLQLFGTTEQRRALENFLIDTAGVASALGASVVVFGAPKNRLKGALSESDAVDSAAPMLRRVATAYAELGCAICIEPNPSRYGGDFCRTIGETRRLIEAVDHPGLRLHLDSGAIEIARESAESVIQAAHESLHFHVSEVDLAPIGSGSVDHGRIAEWLRAGRYAGWHSLEMKPPAPGTLGRAMREALAVAAAYQ